jgi:UDP-GlcNAc:undecaprenyl-phosphate GlcNAc-1-phosphate transferase
MQSIWRMARTGLSSACLSFWSVCLMTATVGQTQSLALVLLISCAIALIFNMLGRVFLGDAGTYGVTFIFGILALRAHNSSAVSAETLAVWFFVPIADCLRLMVSRMRRGQAPSNGDRNHFHHRLQDIFGTTYSCIIYLGAVAGSSITATLVPRLSIVCLIILGAFYAILIGPVSYERRRAVRVPVPRQTGSLRSLANSNVLLLETREGLQKHQ